MCREAIPAAEVLLSVEAFARFDPAGYLEKPGLAPVAAARETTRPLVVGEIQMIGVVLLHGGAAMDHVAVPADEVGHVGEVVASGTTLSRGADVVAPGAILDLTVAVGGGAPADREDAEHPTPAGLGVGAKTTLLVHDGRLHRLGHSPALEGAPRPSVPLSSLVEDLTQILAARRRLGGARLKQQHHDHGAGQKPPRVESQALQGTELHAGPHLHHLAAAAADLTRIASPPQLSRRWSAIIARTRTWKLSNPHGFTPRPDDSRALHRIRASHEAGPPGVGQRR
jgi:hypothetical protein